MMEIVNYTVLTFSVNENLGGTISINGVEYSDFPSNIIITDITSIEAISIEGYEFDYWNYLLEHLKMKTTHLLICL